MYVYTCLCVMLLSYSRLRSGFVLLVLLSGRRNCLHAAEFEAICKFLTSLPFLDHLNNNDLYYSRKTSVAVLLPLDWKQTRILTKFLFLSLNNPEPAIHFIKIKAITSGMLVGIGKQNINLILNFNWAPHLKCMKLCNCLNLMYSSDYKQSSGLVLVF